jgi:type I restriction enzyme S subunit
VTRGWQSHTFDSAPLAIIDGDRGKEYPKQDEFFDDGYCLFLDAGNVTGDGFEFSERHFISEQKDQALRKGRLQREDVVLTTRGTIGNIGLFGENVPYENLRINSGMVILRAKPAELSPAYLYQYLRSPGFKGQVKSFRSGVAQPQLPIRDIKRIQIPMPPFNIQQRIADILSAYDDLIENNRRRMELLEEAARQLYREWFVRLRFPGREHTRIINGVPEGWEQRSIGEVASLNYGKALKEDNRADGEVPVYGSSGVIGAHDKALVNGAGIIVGRKGNVGSVFWCDRPYWPIDTVYFISPAESSLYWFYCLQHVSFQSSDVAVPGLNRTYAHSLKILCPKETIRTQFEENVAPMFEQISKLQSMNEKLRTARDLLLPRLMSGEIAV